MPGGSTQLALIGAADALLTGTPSVTFFRSIPKQYTLFASESISQSFQGIADFGRRATSTMSRQGDLIHTVWLEATLPDLSLFQYDVPQTPSASVPAIVSARYTSSTSALVTIIPPTDNLSTQFIATVTNSSTHTTQTYTVDVSTYPNSIPINFGTSIRATAAFLSVVVQRKKADGTIDAPSASMPIVCLRWCNSVGHALISAVEYEIGGSRIGRHESEFLDMLSELTLPAEKQSGFYTMIGKYDSAIYDLFDNSFSDGRTLYIPLQFPFCRSPSLALPLISLVFHELKLNFEFRDYTQLIKSNVSISSLVDQRGLTPSLDINLWATYFFLDTIERRRFSVAPLEYLIEEVQTIGTAPIIIDPTQSSNLTRRVQLPFSHPVKEILWAYNQSNSYNQTLVPSQYATLGNDYFNTELPNPLFGQDPIASANIQINGSDRYAARTGTWHRLVQTYSHHTRCPAKKIYVYSFCLQPEDLNQPSGSINYSRIDSSYLVFTLNPGMISAAFSGRINVYATSWNVLRIASGMGGLVFVSG
jgi:Large eukaryotic DNA virus major capsid protein/Major capsid protein N-terminus